MAKGQGKFYMAQLLPYPDIGEIAVSLGPIDIRWYGLAYAAGLLLGWLYAKRLINNNSLWNGTSPVTENDIDDFLLWATLGVVLGGRIGYVLFYQPEFYFKNPAQIFYLQNGGMAFHGAIVAVGLIAYLFSRSRKLNFFSLLDLVTASTPIGLFFGRLANFVNGELYGRITDSPIAMIFPNSDGNPRHPSQLYEAALEGLVLFVLLRIATHKFKKLRQPGFVTGMFLAGYGLARSIVEIFYRQPDVNHPISIHTPFTPGLIYSIPMILIGGYLIWRANQVVKTSKTK